MSRPTKLRQLAKQVTSKRYIRRQYYARYLLGKQSGVEIGGLNYPLLPSWLTAPKVTFVDRYHDAHLRQHYPELADEAIVNVDLVADAHRLPFGDATQDFIIANHVIEHMEHVFANLKDYHRILRPGGILYAALPDWAHSWDRPRQRTNYEHLLQEYLRPEIALQQRYEHYLDWTYAFAGTDYTDVLLDTEERVHEHAQHLLAQNYSIHFHVWRGSDFVNHIERMGRDLDFAFEVVAASMADGLYCWSLTYDEFIVILRKP